MCYEALRFIPGFYDLFFLEFEIWTHRVRELMSLLKWHVQYAGGWRLEVVRIDIFGRVLQVRGNDERLMSLGFFRDWRGF